MSIRFYKTNTHRRSWWLILLLAFDLTACRTLRPQAVETEIDIRFVNGGAQVPSIEPVSGWPLTLSLTADEEKLLGIGFRNMQELYPLRGRSGFLVFEDPDGCPSWIDPVWQVAEDYPGCVTPRPPTGWPMDESRVEITPGLTLPDPDPQKAGERPLLETYAGEFATRMTPIGPPVGSDDDGYGYGANPRLPGLVVIANAGPGIVTDESFDRPTPLEARNLAGFFQSVTYELKDARGRTGILVHMNVPKGLFHPVLLVDDSVPKSQCDSVIVRVDGLPEECRETLPSTDEHVVTVRAFVVNVARGQGVSKLADLDGNGIVDVADAERAGFKPLSGQAAFRLVQREGQQIPCSSCYSYDFDGDGKAFGPQGPDGPGGLTDPPR